MTVKNKYIMLNDTGLAIEYKQLGSPDPSEPCAGAAPHCCTFFSPLAAGSQRVAACCTGCMASTGLPLPVLAARHWRLPHAVWPVLLLVGMAQAHGLQARLRTMHGLPSTGITCTCSRGSWSFGPWARTGADVATA